MLFYVRNKITYKEQVYESKSRFSTVPCERGAADAERNTLRRFVFDYTFAPKTQKV